MKLLYNDCKLSGTGRNRPVVYEGRLYKFEESIEGRPSCNIDAEFFGSHIANKAGLHTIEWEKQLVDVVFSNNEVITTRAVSRPWIENVDKCRTFADCVRSFINDIDFYKMMLVDFIVANIDRRSCNVFIGENHRLIPHDFDMSFKFDMVPASVEGFEQVVNHLVLESELQFFEFNVDKLNEAYKETIFLLPLSYLNVIGKDLMPRMQALHDVLLKFLRKWIYVVGVV